MLSSIIFNEAVHCVSLLALFSPLPVPSFSSCKRCFVRAVKNCGIVQVLDTKGLQLGLLDYPAVGIEWGPDSLADYGHLTTVLDKGVRQKFVAH